MFRKTHQLLVVSYVVAILLMLLFSSPKPASVWFLLLGLVGQALLFHVSYYIYKSQQIWYSFYLYVWIYVLYILSFTCMDIYLYLEDPVNFSGRVDKDIRKMFVDFVYLNFCTVSTMGYSDILPHSTLSRSYSSYKIAIAIFVIIFLVSDINIKTR